MERTRAGFVPRDRADVGGPVPWGTMNYVSRCEAALAAYENDGELPPGWTMPPVRSDDEEFDEEPFDPKKPPEPPDTLNFFEWQRSISRLITKLCG